MFTLLIRLEVKRISFLVFFTKFLYHYVGREISDRRKSWAIFKTRKFCNFSHLTSGILFPSFHPSDFKPLRHSPLGNIKTLIQQRSLGSRSFVWCNYPLPFTPLSAQAIGKTCTRLCHESEHHDFFCVSSDNSVVSPVALVRKSGYMLIRNPRQQLHSTFMCTCMCMYIYIHRYICIWPNTWSFCSAR